MRVFIAINFPDDVRLQLATIQSALRQQSISGSFSLPQNLHLTLVFLGEILPARIQAVKSAMDSISSASFALEFADYGQFGDTWWVGIKENSVLSDLQRKLTNALQTGGFPVERRPFRPHLTLGRRIVLQADADLSRICVPTVTAEVGAIHLMKSERLQGKLTYTPIFEKSLL